MNAYRKSLNYFLSFAFWGVITASLSLIMPQFAHANATLLMTPKQLAQIEQQAQAWCVYFAPRLTPRELQKIATELYFLQGAAILDAQLREQMHGLLKSIENFYTQLPFADIPSPDSTNDAQNFSIKVSNLQKTLFAHQTINQALRIASEINDNHYHQHSISRTEPTSASPEFAFTNNSTLLQQLPFSQAIQTVRAHGSNILEEYAQQRLSELNTKLARANQIVDLAHETLNHYTQIYSNCVHNYTSSSEASLPDESSNNPSSDNKTIISTASDSMGSALEMATKNQNTQAHNHDNNMANDHNDHKDIEADTIDLFSDIYDPIELYVDLAQDMRENCWSMLASAADFANETIILETLACVIFRIYYTTLYTYMQERQLDDQLYIAFAPNMPLANPTNITYDLANLTNEITRSTICA